MKSLIRATRLAIGAMALCVAGTAYAQENLDSGKSGGQLFASDCTLCHKSPQGLTKAGGLMGLEGFLREHYTASRESAAAVAAYLRSVDKGAPAAAPAKRNAKGEKKGDDLLNAAEKKTAPGKGSESKSSDTKPSETKPAEAKPSEAKPAETKPAEAKPVEAKPVEKPAEAKPSDDKPSEPKN